MTDDHLPLVEQELASTPDIYFVPRDSAEWDSMWERLGMLPYNQRHPLPTSCYNDGECWQYMGTVRSRTGLFHEFRHRSHPELGRFVVTLQASRSLALLGDDLVE